MKASTHFVVDAQIFRALSFIPTSSSLFPSLRDLTWKESRDEVFPYIRLFIGPLVRLVVHMEGSAITRLSILPALAAMCPDLREVALPDCSSLDPIAISDFVCGLHHLEKLPCGFVSQRALAHLASLPAFEQLFMQISWDLPLQLVIHVKCSFPTLRTITLHPDMLISCAPISTMMSSTPLRHISVFPTIWSTCHDLHGFFEDTQNHTLHSALQDFTIIDRYYIPPDIPDHTITIDTIKPLLCFTNMTSIMLSPTCIVDLDDNGIEEMTKSQLQCLELGSAYGTGKTSRIWIQSLVSLLEYCPDLKC